MRSNHVYITGAQKCGRIPAAPDYISLIRSAFVHDTPDLRETIRQEMARFPHEALTSRRVLLWLPPLRDPAKAGLWLDRSIIVL